MDRRTSRLLYVVLPVIVAALPLLVAAVRAAAGPWMPIGDNAYFTVRSLDVATDQHPLLGAWSAGSVTIDRPINNLGPLQLDLLAPFTRWTPWGGTAIGVIVVHIAAIASIGWMIACALGPRYVLPAMVAVSTMTWNMGSEMLITPQQHQYLLLPYLCVLVGAWCLAAGDRWSIVPVVFFGSLVAQTHLSYPVLLATLAIPIAVGQVLAIRRAASGGADGTDVRPGSAPWWTPYAVAGVLAAVLWVQTAIDQFAGFGNFTDVLTASGDSRSPDLLTAARITAGVVISPAGLIRPGYGDYGPTATLANGLEVGLLVALIVVLLGGAIVAMRRGRRVAAAGCGVASAALVGAVLDSRLLPIAEPFGLLSSNYRFLWPTATLLLMGALCALTRRVAYASAGRWRPIAQYSLAALLVAATVANLPTAYEFGSADQYRDDQVATRSIVDQIDEQLDAVGANGPIVIDESNMYLGHPYTYPILTILRVNGVEYRFDSPVQARRFGEERVSDGTEELRLVMWFGDEAVARQGDAGLIAYTGGSPPVAVTVIDEA